MRKPLWLLAFFVGNSQSGVDRMARNPLRYARSLKTRLREANNTDELAEECAKIERNFNRHGKKFVRYLAVKIRVKPLVSILAIVLMTTATAIPRF